MTITRSQVVNSLMNCLSDPAQAEKVREWSDRSEDKAPGLDGAGAVLLFAAAMGDATSWAALVRMHPSLAGLDASDMPTVLDRLFARSQP